VRRFGSDKPDLRYGLEIADVTEVVAASGFAVFARAVTAGGRVRALACPGAAALTRRELDDLQAFAKEWGGQGLAYLLFEESGDVRSPIAKFLTPRRSTASGPPRGRARDPPCSWPPTPRTWSSACSAPCDRTWPPGSA
jgi:aspartyl-tRNA synthetase